MKFKSFFIFIICPFQKPYSKLFFEMLLNDFSLVMHFLGYIHIAKICRVYLHCETETKIKNIELKTKQNTFLQVVLQQHRQLDMYNVCKKLSIFNFV